MALNDFRSVLQCFMKAQPDEVYNLAGQSSVGLSFEQPVETLESICFGTLNILEAIRLVNKSVKFYNACSSECFGDTGKIPSNESTPFRPKSPYAVAKSAAFWEVDNYREAYGIYACSGILFNHESPFRHPRFVTGKVVNMACKIAAGSTEKLVMGDLSIVRDWGWAVEYVEAMWRMLQLDSPEDFVVATGQSYKLQDFVATVFARFGLDWQKHVVTDLTFVRQNEIRANYADPSKAQDKLGWRAEKSMLEVASLMVDAEKKKYPNLHTH